MGQRRTYFNKNTAKGQAGNLFDSKAGRPMIDVRRQGQNGFRHAISATDDDGSSVINLHNDTKHQSTQVIPVLLQGPKGFDSFENPQSWYDALKQIVETRAETITGLKGSLTVEFAESTVSGAGEIFSQPINVTRERSEVEFLWKDLVGRPIQKTMTAWIQYFMMDPDTKVPKINFLEKYVTDSWTTEYQSMTMLFIEMDVSHRYVDKAWLVTGMMPKTDGAKEGRRNYNEAAAVLELTIGFTGVTEQTEATIELAEKVYQTLTFIKTDTDFVKHGVEGRDTYLANDVSKVGFEAPSQDGVNAHGAFHTTA